MQNMLESIGSAFPQGRNQQIILGSIVGISVVFDQPEIALTSVLAAMGIKAWLNWRHNDMVDVPDSASIVAQNNSISDDYGIVQMLDGYGLEGAKLIEVMPGAVLNRYIVQLPSGTRSNDMPSTDDMAMALGVRSVVVNPANKRMCKELDLPAPTRQTVDFDALLDSREWAIAKASNMRLPVCPAVTVDGKPYIIDLADGVHYFIAGTTGAGKSVFANAIMLSLMDSGREFTLLCGDGKYNKGDFYPYYSKSSHLLNSYRDMVDGEPACKGMAIEPEDMADQFAWLVWAMEERLKGNQPTKPLIYLMDEMKDVVDMLSASDDKNALKAFIRNVGRLAQKARSVNITILFCTQSPNSEWLPQTLRAVIPSAFGMMVSSGAQSRVCIGENGCEKLLGKGDAIAKINGTTTRIHGANVTRKHLEELVK